MRHAAGARVSIGNVLGFFFGPRVQQMQNRQDRLAGRIHAQKAVPKGAATHGRDAKAGRMYLLVQLIQAGQAEIHKAVRIHFRATAGRGLYLMG